MGVKIKGRYVTLTGKHAELIIEKAKDLGVEPQVVFLAALREALKPEHSRELEEELRKAEPCQK